MKTIISLTALLVFIGLTGCKPSTPTTPVVPMPKTEPLVYGNTITAKLLQTEVKLKESGKRVIWFQLFDQVGDKKLIDDYAKATEQVLGYPAKISKDKWIWVLIANRFELRLMADTQNTEYQNSEKIQAFIKTFDLDAMKVFAGPRMKSEDMKRFIPKL